MYFFIFENYTIILIDTVSIWILWFLEFKKYVETAPPCDSLTEQKTVLLIMRMSSHYDEKFCFNENLNKFHQKFIMLCSEWLKKQQWKLPPQISSIEQKKCYLEIDHIFLYPKPINTNLRRLVQYYYIISYIESHRALIRLPKLL